jgi:hypothetical protein
MSTHYFVKTYWFTVLQGATQQYVEYGNVSLTSLHWLFKGSTLNFTFNLVLVAHVDKKFNECTLQQKLSFENKIKEMF